MTEGDRLAAMDQRMTRLEDEMSSTKDDVANIRVCISKISVMQENTISAIRDVKEVNKVMLERASVNDRKGSAILASVALALILLIANIVVEGGLQLLAGTG